MPRTTVPFCVGVEDESLLNRWLAAAGTPQQVTLRCQIIQSTIQGETESSIADSLGINRKTVRLWKERVKSNGIQSVWEIAPGRGRKPKFSSEKIQTVIEATLQTKPEGATHWSCRTMAEAQQMGKSTVSKLWRSHNLNHTARRPSSCREIPSFWRS